MYTESEAQTNGQGSAACGGAAEASGKIGSRAARERSGGGSAAARDGKSRILSSFHIIAVTLPSIPRVTFWPRPVSAPMDGLRAAPSSSA